tara:strand:+ start:144 stop:689 length:546 start_codon:yes stop_codon:yes gene_type:complete
MAVGESDLSVFLRNGTHAGATVRLVLKCDQVSVQYTQSPIQITPPNSDQIMFELGFSKPSMTISGIIDNIGGDTSNASYSATADLNVKGMEYLTLNSQNYFIPYKNYLEGFLMRHPENNKQLEIELGDATTPDPTAGAFTTGGAIYIGALQQLQFSQTPGLEDRWLFTMGFLIARRAGVAD